MTAWPSEQAAIENMIDHFGSGIFACVMDSYDYVKVSVSLCHGALERIKVCGVRKVRVQLVSCTL